MALFVPDPIYYILSDLLLWGILIHEYLSFSVAGLVHCANPLEVHESREVPLVNRVIYHVIVRLILPFAPAPEGN